MYGCIQHKDLKDALLEHTDILGQALKNCKVLNPIQSLSTERVRKFVDQDELDKYLERKLKAKRMAKGERVKSSPQPSTPQNENAHTKPVQADSGNESVVSLENAMSTKLFTAKRKFLGTEVETFIKLQGQLTKLKLDIFNFCRKLQIKY